IPGACPNQTCPTSEVGHVPKRQERSPGARDVFEDLAPAGEEELMGVVEEVERRVREALLVVAGDRRWADAVVLAPPEGDRGADVRELEAPRPTQVRELAGQPEAAVAERLGAPAGVSLVRQSVSGRRRWAPAPSLEAPRGDAGGDAGDADHVLHVAGQRTHAVGRRHRPDERD